MDAHELEAFLQPAVDRWEREGGLQALLEEAFPVHLGDDDTGHHALVFAGYAVRDVDGLPIVAITVQDVGTVERVIHSIREQSADWIGFAPGPGSDRLVSTDLARTEFLAAVEDRIAALRVQVVERFAARAGGPWEPADLVAG